MFTYAISQVNRDMSRFVSKKRTKTMEWFAYVLLTIIGSGAMIFAIMTIYDLFGPGSR